MNPGSLPLTGERTVPGIPEENYWFRRHEVAYRYALPLVTGVRVLEVGCGEGYGTALLGTAARDVLGLDYDALTVAHAAVTYPTVRFVRGNLAALPVASGAIDAVASLQVIEHVWNHAEFLGECRRVLCPGGLLLVTTPNRLTFSPGRDAPLNPFHTKEFTAAEMDSLLVGCGFEVSSVLGLSAGPRLRALDDAHGGSFVGAQLATPPAEWSDGLRADVASVTVDDFDIDGRDVDAALDLVVLARCADAADLAVGRRAGRRDPRGHDDRGRGGRGAHRGSGTDPGHPRARGRPLRARAGRGRGGRRAGPVRRAGPAAAARRPGHGQGDVRGRGDAEHRRLPAPPPVPRTGRRHGGRTAAGGRGDRARPRQHVRLSGLDRVEQSLVRTGVLRV